MASQSYKCWVAALGLLAIVGTAAAMTPLGTEFTYQGQLKLGGVPLNDSADFEFTLWDADTAGNRIGSLVAVNNVIVVGGLFTVELGIGLSNPSDPLHVLSTATRSARLENTALSGTRYALWAESDSTSGRGVYSELTPLLVEAVNALRAEKDAEIAILRTEKNQEIDALHAENDALRARLDSLERLLNARHTRIQRSNTR